MPFDGYDDKPTSTFTPPRSPALADELVRPHQPQLMKPPMASIGLPKRSRRDYANMIEQYRRGC
jgi:hypothetical protein